MSNIIYFHFDGNLIAGDNFDIHDNASVNIYQKDVSRPATKEDQPDVEDIKSAASTVENIPLFRFIHPSVTKCKKVPKK